MEVPNKQPHSLIASVIAALQHNHLQPSSEEVADALWLAHKTRQTLPKGPVTGGVVLPPKVKLAPEEAPPSSRPKPSIKREDSGSNRSEVHQRSPSGKGDSLGMPFKSPTTTALPGVRELEQALRPFMRRIPSRTKLVFDESATVERIACEEIWAPVLSFARERWFEVALVVEESASMVIWQQAIAEFFHLLSRLGAFRDVRVWKLATDRDQIQLYEGSKRAVGSRRPRHPHELIDPTGRRLILVVTDCIAPAWHRGQVAKLLAPWADVSPVALVQVLPQRLWRGTALDRAIELSLRAPAANVPNRQLQAESDDLWFDEWPLNGVKVPIVTLERESLALWARMVTGAGVQTAGFLLNPNPPTPTEHDLQEPSRPPLSPMERVRRFYGSVTPMAYQLATYFAAVPLTLPVMRLVQHTMLPKSRQVHLAEVFLSGLLKQVGTAEHPEHIQYDFADGIRELLLNSLLVSEAVDVLGTVSNFIAKQTGQPFDFQALIADPTATDGIVISEHSRPFATVAAEVLDRFGGRYVQAAERLADFAEEIPTDFASNVLAPYQNGQSLTQDTESALANLAQTMQSLTQEIESALANLAETTPSLTEDTESVLADLAQTMQSLTKDTERALANFAEIIPKDFASNILVPYENALTDLAETMRSLTQDTQSAFADLAETMQSLTQDTQSAFADLAETMQSLTQDTQSAFADLAETMQSLTQDAESAHADLAQTIETLPSTTSDLTTNAKLVDLLLACASMVNWEQRQTIINELRGEIRENFGRRPVSRDEVMSLVNACLSYDGGLEELIELVRFFEGPSKARQALDQFSAGLSKASTFAEDGQPLLDTIKLNLKQKSELVTLLLACSAVSNRAVWHSIINQLPADIRNLTRSAVGRIEVANLVDACLDYGGLDELIEVVRYFEGQSKAWRALDEFWAGLSTLAEDGQVLVRDSNPPPSKVFNTGSFLTRLQAPGGAVRLDDKLYVRRQADDELQREMVQWGTTTTIRAPRQTGKTSLLVRALHYAKERGCKTLFVDLPSLADRQRHSLDALLYELAMKICRDLRLDEAKVEKVWQAKRRYAKQKMTYFLEDEVLPVFEKPVILAMDEVDSLLATDFYEEFFALVRSWHNLRAFNGEQWEKLNLVLLMSTEPSLLIRDINQSPFNVGRTLNLADFTRSEVEWLNEQHGTPLEEQRLPDLMELLGGHPYLTRQAFYTLVKQDMSWDQLSHRATDDQGPFSQHLQRYYGIIHDKPELKRAFREVIRYQRCPDEPYRLRLLKVGLIKDENGICTCRCELYRRYFERRVTIPPTKQ